MARRQLPEINAGSMADIAFLLLIFFLVATQMDKEAGIFRILPEISNVKSDPIPQKNVIEVILNDDGKLMFEGEIGVPISEVSERIQEMILNRDKRGDWPSVYDVEYSDVNEALNRAKKAYEDADEINKPKKLKELNTAQLRVEAYELFTNNFKKSSHIISLQATKGSDYNDYIKLSDQILGAYKSLKVKLAKKVLNKGWGDLTTKEKDMLDLVYPTSISEAQTVDGSI